ISYKDILMSRGSERLQQFPPPPCPRPPPCPPPPCPKPPPRAKPPSSPPCPPPSCPPRQPPPGEPGPPSHPWRQPPPHQPSATPATVNAGVHGRRSIAAAIGGRIGIRIRCGCR